MYAQDWFDTLPLRLRAGDPDAARQVFNQFAGRLVALARTRLGQRLRQKVDPEDVVQSALRSFFLRCADGQLDFGNPDQLWSLLVLFTLRKCCRQARRSERIIPCLLPRPRAT